MVPKYENKCKISWEHDTRTFSFQALCGQEVKCQNKAMNLSEAISWLVGKIRLPDIPVVRTIRGEKGARWRRGRVCSVHRLVVLKVVLVPMTPSEPSLVAFEIGLGRRMVS